MTPFLRRCLSLAALAALPLLACAAPAGAAPFRVAALTPFTANTLAELGVRPVAIGQTLGGHDRIDPRLKRVPTLALSHPNGPSIEQLAVRNPQLVLSAQVWRKGEPAMKRLGMRVVESDPAGVASVMVETRRIGGLVGRSAQAAKLAAGQAAAIAQARQGIRRHPTVLLIMGVGRTSYAMLQNSWGGDLVRQAGGRLLTGGLKASGGYAQVSDEAVVARDPDVIIAVRQHHVYVATGNSLLQAYTDPGRTIADVRSRFLRN